MEKLDLELVRDQIAGVEPELIEVVEQQHRAKIQGRIGEAEHLQAAIDVHHAKLVRTADAVAAVGDRGSTS